MIKRLLSFGILVFLFSCNEKSAEKKTVEQIDIYDKEYYPSGGLKKETKYIGGNLLDKEVTYYNANGGISKKCKYSEGKLNGEFMTFDLEGRLISKGFFRKGNAIGSTYYYTKGKLTLYNERDLNGEVYYVKKYDSTTFKLIKEEGVCLTQKPVIEKYKNEQHLYFSYSQPDGYVNDIRVEFNEKEIKFDTIQGHLGLIKLKFPDTNGEAVKIFSTLKFNSLIICQDSLQVFIH